MFTDEQFGTFMFDMRTRCFEAEIAYSDDFISISLERTEDIETLRHIYENFTTFLSDATAYAADQLMDLANEWGRDTWDEKAEGEKYTPLTRKDFIGLLTLTGIDLSGNGRYSLCVPRRAELSKNDRIFCAVSPGKRQRLVRSDAIGASKRHDAA
jgi:hypothetical protein